MNVFKAIGRFFTGVGALIVKAMNFAQERGLDDALVAHAMWLVREAAGRYIDNAERNQWAVNELRRNLRAIPESVAKLAIELAVQAVKAELTRGR